MDVKQATVQQIGASNDDNIITASLYFGDLSPTVSESNIQDLLSQNEYNVSSVKICRDKITRASLGYAYVNFLDVKSAELAISTLNYKKLHGKEIRVMWSQRDPQSRILSKGNVFVKNLPKDKEFSSSKLCSLFSIQGSITSCKVPVDEKGVSKGFGFINFTTEQDAKTAIEKTNGMLYQDKEIYVGNFIKSDIRVDNDNVKFNNIYVKNLPDDEYDNDELEELFKKFGSISSAVVAKDDKSVSKGFGFVYFEEADEAVEAVKSLNGTEQRGKILQVGRAQKKIERTKNLKIEYERRKRQNQTSGSNLQIKYLDEKINDEILKAEFEKYGEILSAKVVTKKVKSEENNDVEISCGFGFVSFKKHEDAQEALKNLNGKLIFNKPLYVSFAQRKDERKNMLLAMLGVQKSDNPQQSTGMQQPFQGSQNRGMNRGMDGRGRNFQRGKFQQRGNMHAMNYNMRGMMPQQMMNPNMRGGMQQMMNPRGGMEGMRVMYQPVNTRGMQIQPNQMQIPNVNKQKMAQTSQARNMEPKAKSDVKGFDYSKLANMNVQQQKQILGEVIQPMVHEKAANQAGKITGMLLEMENQELLTLIDSPEQLDRKVQEAITVLEYHEMQQGKND